MENNVKMDIKGVVNPKNYDCGVIIARFQVHELHEAHKGLIDKVKENHKKIIIFLGVAVIQNTKNNPLDFATRKAMIQEYIPNAVILPIKDNRSNAIWSSSLDSNISMIFGESKALLYGSRDSFIPYYEGRYKTTELTTDTFVSGTEIRNNVSKEILESKDFRAGVIHANYAQRAVLYPTVDIVMYNGEGQILLAKKPNEPQYRFVGGFVDPTDEKLEYAARREFREETGGNCEIGPLTYVTSQQINDWRYAKEESGIMTTFFIGGYRHGFVKPSDDISVLKWIDITDFTTSESIEKLIQPEHRGLMQALMDKLMGGEFNQFNNLIDKLKLVENEA